MEREQFQRLQNSTHTKTIAKTEKLQLIHLSEETFLIDKTA
jgi:hypothetical protein